MPGLPSSITPCPNRVRELRHLRGIARMVTLSELTGIQLVRLSRIETNLSTPSYWEALAISRALGCSMEVICAERY